MPRAKREVRVNWRIAIIIRVNTDGCVVSEEIGGKYRQNSFIVEKSQRRKLVPSQYNLLDWGKSSCLIEDIVPGDHIVFEKTDNGEIVGWCSHEEYKKAGFKSLRNINVNEANAA